MNNSQTKTNICVLCGAELVQAVAGTRCLTCTPLAKPTSEPTLCHPRRQSDEEAVMEALLFAAAGAAPDQAIYASEARGQTEMVQSESVPTELNLGTEADLLAMGIQLGDPYPQDPLFRPAILPDGWVRRPTSHSMWSEVLDAQGRIRLRIYYKAAFYDRRASLHIEPRFRIESGRLVRSRQPGFEPEGPGHPGDDDFVVMDYGNASSPAELYRVKALSTPLIPYRHGEDPEIQESWSLFHEAQSAARRAAWSWLNTNYPSWLAPSAYWDEC